MNEENKNISPSSNDEQANTNLASEYHEENAGVPAAEQPETPDTQPETINDMEVHHHTHASHGKKDWKNYFWEFLMLFLAVFCGFLAEYQLEHKIEKDREKQFLSSLLIDLQDDVTSVDLMISMEKAGIAQLDTLMQLLNNPDQAKQHGDQLYYTARVGPRSQPFANNSRTFDQLKYSGGFRLIRKAASSNKIMAYYNLFGHLRLMEDNFNHEFDNYKRVAAKIIDPAILRQQEGTDGEIQLGNSSPTLLTYDGIMLKELAFHTLQMAGSRRSKILVLENLKTNATELLSYLKGQYQLN